MWQWNCQGRQFHGHFFPERISGHKTAKVGSSMATFGRGWKVAMKLPGSAVWEPKPPVCWKPAMKLPRSAVWDHSAENRPWNCQGQQFENINLFMDRANGWKAAMKLPRSAVWGPKGPKGWKLAMKLPRSAVWERGRETAKVGSLSPQKKVWFKLPTLAVLWPLFQTARYGRFAQVWTSITGGNNVTTSFPGQGTAGGIPVAKSWLEGYRVDASTGEGRILFAGLIHVCFW